MTEILRDGRRLECAPLQPRIATGLVAAAGRSSGEDACAALFLAKRGFSEKEIEFYTNVDFVSHVALVAVVEAAGKPLIVGGGRYIVAQPAAPKSPSSKMRTRDAASPPAPAPSNEDRARRRA